jgi:hypothetical protein
MSFLVLEKTWNQQLGPAIGTHGRIVGVSIAQQTFGGTVENGYLRRNQTD